MGRPRKPTRLRIGEKLADVKAKRVADVAFEAANLGLANARGKSVAAEAARQRSGEAREGLEAALALNSTRINTETSTKDAELRAMGMRKLIKGVKDGLFLGDSCALAGVSRNILNNWRNKGQLGIEPYAQFLRDLEAADACAKESKLAELFALDCSPEEKAKSLRWFLERRWPQQLAERHYICVQGTDKIDEILQAIQGVTDAQTFGRIIDAIANLGRLGLGGPGHPSLGGSSATDAPLLTAGTSVD